MKSLRTQSLIQDAKNIEQFKEKTLRTFFFRGMIFLILEEIKTTFALLQIYALQIDIYTSICSLDMDRVQKSNMIFQSGKFAILQSERFAILSIISSVSIKQYDFHYHRYFQISLAQSLRYFR